MKDSKEKEHRISNLKDMINNVKNDAIISNDDVEEDNLEIFIKEVLKTLLFNHGLIVYEWSSETI